MLKSIGVFAFVHSCIIFTPEALSRSNLRSDASNFVYSTTFHDLEAAACAVRRDEVLGFDDRDSNVECPRVSAALESGKSSMSAAATSGLQQIEFLSTGDFQGNTRRHGTALNEQTVVWVSGYARSGTSTALSMVAAAGAKRFDNGNAEEQENSEVLQLSGEGSGSVAVEQDGTVFAMFEPCHFSHFFWQGGDKVTGNVAKEGCKGLVKALAECNFSEVRSLHLWANRHSVHVGVEEYSESAAAKACLAADIVAYKTIYYGHDLRDKAVPLVEMDPRMRVISVVRDPRGIFASWKTTWPFSYRVGRHLMTDICSNFAKNLNVSHPQIHKLVYEELAADPENVTRRLYSFLGLPFGHRQKNWIAKNFNADCGNEGDYTDCKANSSSHIQAWSKIMLPYEKRLFLDYQPCRVVAAHYGYSLED